MVKLNRRKLKGGLFTQESGIRTKIRNQYIPELRMAKNIYELDTLKNKIQQVKNECDINNSSYNCNKLGITSKQNINDIINIYDSVYNEKKAELTRSLDSRSAILNTILKTLNNGQINTNQLTLQTILFVDFINATGGIAKAQKDEIEPFFKDDHITNYGHTYITDMNVFIEFKTQIESSNIISGGKIKTRKVRRTRKTRKSRKSRKTTKSKKFRRK